MYRMLLTIGVLLAFFYLAILALVYFGQRGFVYHPTREVFANPRQTLGLEYEDVFFSAADGTRLAGWYTPAPGSDLVVLYCHGNGGNLAHRCGTVAVYHELGLSSLFFDYRGYGASSGTPSEDGTYEDAQAAWDFLTTERGYRPDQIILVGRSLGGAVAAELATRRTPAVLCLESTFTRVTDVAARMFPYLPVRLVTRYHYDTASRLHRIKCPIFVTHGRDDRVIPMALGRRLYELAPEPKTYVELLGGHMDAYEGPASAYPEALARFLSENIGFRRGSQDLEGED